MDMHPDVRAAAVRVAELRKLEDRIYNRYEVEPTSADLSEVPDNPVDTLMGLLEEQGKELPDRDIFDAVATAAALLASEQESQLTRALYDHGTPPEISALIPVLPATISATTWWHTVAALTTLAAVVDDDMFDRITAEELLFSIENELHLFAADDWSFLFNECAVYIQQCMDEARHTIQELGPPAPEM